MLAFVIAAAVAFLIMPVCILPAAIIQRVTGLRYKIGKKHLHTMRGPFPWRMLSEYREYDHPSLPGIRCIDVMLVPRAHPVTLYFDPATVDEKAILRLLELPVQPKIAQKV